MLPNSSHKPQTFLERWNLIWLGKFSQHFSIYYIGLEQVVTYSEGHLRNPINNFWLSTFSSEPKSFTRNMTQFANDNIFGPDMNHKPLKGTSLDFTQALRGISER